MNTKHSPITDTMLPWMGTVFSNKDKLTSLINNNNNKNKNTPYSSPTTKKTLPFKKSTKMKYTLKSKSNQRQNDSINQYLINHSKPQHPSDSEGDPYWGHPYTSKSPKSIRIWYTNPCGLGLDSDDVKSHASFSFLKQKSKTDIVCFAETNVHWKRLTAKHTLYNRLKRLWSVFRYVTSHNTHESLGVGQRGGTCTFCTGQTSYRVSDKGTDPSGLGRWSWLQFSGKDEFKTRIYTAYRPGNKPSTKSRLTTVYEQHKRYMRDNKISAHPKDMFDEHIVMELETVIKSGINVILAIDANDDIVSGQFSKKMKTIGLFNSLTNNSFPPIPPTHYNGSKPISTIYCTQSLQILRTGILQKYTGVRGDHKNIFIDISESTFLGESMYKIVRPELRRLKLNDPRIVNKFLKYAELHLRHNNISNFSHQLIQDSTYPPTPTMIKNQEILDDQIGRAISAGLKKCRTIHMGEIPYSPELQKYRDLNRFWLMAYNRKVGKTVSSSLLKRLSKRVNISNYMSIPLPEIKHKLNESRIAYKKFVPYAPSERRQHLEELASVYATEGIKSKESALKQLLNTESSREQAIITRIFFPKKTISTRVDKVQYEKNGEIVETNKPKQLIDALQNENKDKYSCTNGTPLMTPTVHKLLGNFAETKCAQDIFYHRTPIPTTIPKWSAKMISKVLYDKNIPNLPQTISTQEVSRTWRITKENKAAPLSGRYNAVYKAFCKSPFTLNILTNAMNVPFLTGMPYERWRNMLDIMTFKSSNSIMVNSLRSIIIAEADWNAAGRIHITRRMMNQAEKYHLLPHEHIGGRKNKKSIEGAITKRLLMENSQLMRRPMIVLSTDAANCYDRVIHKYVAFTCNKWGIPTPVIKALLQPLQQAKHFTRTAYGDSDSFFTGTNLQGVGQGNTGAAPFWTCVSTSMIEILKECGYNSTFISAISLDIVKLALIAFVDDSEIFLTIPSNNLADLITLADRTLNTWREALQVTGGAMRANKCGWTLISYDTKGNLKVRNQCEGRIYIPEEDGTIKEIARYDPNIARQYLGVLQTADGDDSFQLDKMYADVAVWNNKIAKSKMLPIHNLQALMNRIYKTLTYPLPALTLDYETYHKLSNKLTTTSIPKCNISSKFPRDFRYLPRKYHGLSLPDLYLVQNLAQLRELITHNGHEGVLGKQINLALENIQVELGLNGLFLNYPHSTYGHLVPSSWMTSIWQFMSRYNLHIRGWAHNINPLRVNDLNIMETFSSKGYSTEDIQKLNQCRIYLQAHSLADICNSSGHNITQKALTGIRDPHRQSKLIWRQLRRPSQRTWLLWDQALHRTFCANDTNSTLQQPLGRWLRPPRQSWQWYYESSTDTLYRSVDNLIRVYTRTSNAPARALRSRAVWYKARKVITPDHFNTKEYSLATITSTDRGQYMAAMETYTAPPTSPHTASPPQNLYEQLISDKVPPPLLQHQKTYLQNITPSTLLPFANRTVRAVSDGSFKLNKGAAAIIFETIDQDHSLIFTTPVPINTQRHDGDPYRTELFGLLFSLHIIDSTERLLNTSGKFILSCDNDEALNKSQLDQIINTSLKHQDILKSIQYLTKRIKSSLDYEEVLGHAKDKVKRPLTRTEILNDHCDILANNARESLPEVNIMQISLLGEGLSLWHKSTKMYKDMTTQISNLYYKHKAKPIICQKFNLQPAMFSTIDWDSLERATSLLSPMHNVYLSKHVIGFLPIGKNMERRGAWKAPFCPRCQHPIESAPHLIKCTSTSARRILKSSSSKLITWLESTDTDPTLLTFIIELTTSFIHGTITPPHPNHPHPIRKQLQLGWHHFLYGRIHTSFIPHMSAYYSSINSRRSASSWAAVLIQKLWTIYHLPQWTDRNKYVHNLDRVTDSTRERINLQTSLQNAYNSDDINNLLASDKHLLEKPLRQLKQMPNALIRAWLLEHKTAIMARNRIFDADNARSSAILRSFLTRHPNTLPQTAASSHQNANTTISINTASLPLPKFNTPRPIPPQSIPPPQQYHIKRKRSPTTNNTHKQKNQRTKYKQKFILTPPIPPHHSLNTCNPPDAPHLRQSQTHYSTHHNNNIGLYVSNLEYASVSQFTTPPQPYTWSTNGTKTALMQGSWRPP